MSLFNPNIQIDKNENTMSEMIYRTDELDISDVLYLYKVACILKCSAKKL